MIGHVIGSYRVVRELGRPAALEMLLPQMSSDPGIVQRFFHRVRIHVE